MEDRHVRLAEARLQRGRKKKKPLWSLEERRPSVLCPRAATLGSSPAKCYGGAAALGQRVIGNAGWTRLMASWVLDREVMGACARFSGCSRCFQILSGVKLMLTLLMKFRRIFFSLQFNRTWDRNVNSTSVVKNIITEYKELVKTASGLGEVNYPPPENIFCIITSCFSCLSNCFSYKLKPKRFTEQW